MSRKLYSPRLILCASALALVAGAAQAQTVSPSATTAALTYTRGSGVVTPSATITVTGSTDSVTYTVTGAAAWLAPTYGGTAGTGDGPGPTDSLTFAVIPSIADAQIGAVYTSTVTLMVGGSPSGTITVTLTENATTPFTPTPSAISLTYVKNGVANQPSAKTTAAIAGSDTIADTYTLTGLSGAALPGWLSATALHGSASATVGDTITFQVIQGGGSGGNSLSAGPTTFNLHLVSGNPTYNQDLVIVVTINVIAAQPLGVTVASNPLSFAYTVGSSTLPSSQSASVTVTSGTLAFNLDPSTVPSWLTATASGSASTSGATVTFAPVSAVVKGLGPGNYSGSIGYEAVNAESELLIPVVLVVSNPTANVTLKGNASNALNVNYPVSNSGGILNSTLTQPSPVFTVLSSDEPAGFTAVCSVTTTNPAYVEVITPQCSLAGASSAGSTVTGIAYTFGTALTATLDSALFSTGTPFGTLVTVTVHATGPTGTVSQSYAYTILPVAPTFTAVSPTSVAQITANSFLFTITGTNFVPPDSILGTSIPSTVAFVGTSALAASNVTVLNPTTMLLSVPFGSFPAYPTGKTTVNMVLGGANDTAAATPSVATATETVVITTAPVVYAVTSTATYVQPNPGTNQSVAPYELISIFGAQFGPTSNLTGTLTAFDQFNTTVNVSGAGTTASPYLSVSVTFTQSGTAYKAPILFANGTQINCIVPSGLTVGSNATVKVSYGSTTAPVSSDGLFTVGVVTSQPGIFTLASDGVGQGAILNHDYSVNGSGNPASANSSIYIYMTGLGAPTGGIGDSSAVTSGLWPTDCVAISNATTGNPSYPGYLQTVNNVPSRNGYTAPSPLWTNIDGAVMNPTDFLGTGLLPPCFANSGSTAMTVNFGTTSPVAGTITYAGFVSGSVAGLYQINVTVPSGLPTGNVPVTFSIGSNTSPAGVVTVAVH